MEKCSLEKTECGEKLRPEPSLLEEEFGPYWIMNRKKPGKDLLIGAKHTIQLDGAIFSN